MGILGHATLGLVAEVGQSSAVLCALEEAKQWLNGRDIAMNIKTIRNKVKPFAAIPVAYEIAGIDGEIRGEHNKVFLIVTYSGPIISVIHYLTIFTPGRHILNRDVKNI